MMKIMEGTVTEEAFISILMLDGAGTITADSENISYKKEDSLLCYLVCWSLSRTRFHNVYSPPRVATFLQAND